MIQKTEWEVTPGATYKVKVGCGNLYVTICYDDKRRFRRIFIPRNSKFYCPLTTRDAIAKMGTFQGKRSMRQLIKDLRGNKAHYCEKYNVTAEATSCFDAVSRALGKWLKVKRKRSYTTKHRESATVG